jgi:hypothetical protein
MIPKLPVRTFPVSAGLLEHKQRMGIAIWEYLWLLEHVTEDKPDGDGKYKGIVRYGHAISATEIAKDLRQSLRATQSNLRKLTRDAYITRHLTSAGYSYVVTNSKKWIWKRTNGQPGETTVLFADQESGSEESCRPPHVGRKLPRGATKVADGCDESCRCNKEKRQIPMTNTEDKNKDNSPAVLFEDLQARGTPCLKKKSQTPPIEIPDWIPTESWLGFVEMRTTIKKPLTPRAVELAIAQLGKLRDAGYPPGAVLDQSVMNGWLGLFPLKDGWKVKTQTRGEKSVEAGLRVIAEMEAKGGAGRVN